MLRWDDELDRRIQQERAWREEITRPLREQVDRLALENARLGYYLQTAQERLKALQAERDALAAGALFPQKDLEEVRKVLEEAWLELALMASPVAEGLARLIQRLERFWADRSPP
ncbi:hypothetical protein [Thermus igniterrae]|jgi:predicted RNase H-like nuclease (RuvC/YqgF family)|uniref:hypothetical protein n=1 Tax=Thermus igniterrae TaxID=88189 RepID=UPI000361D20F|nr:hypothetical protein [Thermus igniterrae]